MNKRTAVTMASVLTMSLVAIAAAFAFRFGAPNTAQAKQKPIVKTRHRVVTVHTQSGGAARVVTVGGPTTAPRNGGAAKTSGSSGSGSESSGSGLDDGTGYGTDDGGYDDDGYEDGGYSDSSTPPPPPPSEGY